jgi:histidine triad (HIT) family protein
MVSEQRPRLWGKAALLAMNSLGAEGANIVVLVTRHGFLRSNVVPRYSDLNREGTMRLTNLGDDSQFGMLTEQRAEELSSRLKPNEHQLTLANESSAVPQSGEDIFCRLKVDDNQIIQRFDGELGGVFSVVDVFPTAKFQTLVLPYGHYANLADMPDKLLAQIGTVSFAYARKQIEITSTEMVIISVNNGAVAKQQVPHLHMHVMPMVPLYESHVIERDLNGTKKYEKPLSSAEKQAISSILRI